MTMVVPPQDKHVVHTEVSVVPEHDIVGARHRRVTVVTGVTLNDAVMGDLPPRRPFAVSAQSKPTTVPSGRPSPPHPSPPPWTIQTAPPVPLVPRVSRSCSPRTHATKPSFRNTAQLPVLGGALP